MTVYLNCDIILTIFISNNCPLSNIYTVSQKKKAFTMQDEQTISDGEKEEGLNADALNDEGGLSDDTDEDEDEDEDEEKEEKEEVEE